jgi:protocatechuate 3,4-dioxygenase, beta subunit
MFRVILFFVLIITSWAQLWAGNSIENKFLSLFPYKTKTNTKDIVAVVGLPLPKPGVHEIIDNEKVKESQLLNIYTADDYFIYPALDSSVLFDCVPTPALKNSNSDVNYSNVSSNNLRRKTGSPDVAEGHIIYIKGFLRDINCYPIAGAKITIWHNNAKGFNNSDVSNSENYDPYFQAAGFSVSSNDGSFEFITILPGSYDGYAPFINFYIAIPKREAFETQIFFQDHQLNDSDIRLKKLPKPMKDLLIADVAPVNQDNVDEGFYMVIDLVANIAH